MPEMDGLEACRRLREDAHLRTLPILMLTALGKEEDHVKGLDVEADIYIAKPVSVPVLISQANAPLRSTRRRFRAGGERLSVAPPNFKIQNPKPEMKIVFMGTPNFAVPSLKHLVEAGHAPVAVVTGPDRPRGRGQKLTPTPVKKAAQRLDVAPIVQPESVRDPDFAEEIATLAPDVIAVVAFKILPPEVFTQATKGAFNLHGSLLPRYRGAAPINRAVMAGETETGVTTFFLEPTVDTGDIILQKRMDIGPDETAGSVHDRMAKLGAKAVVETVQTIEASTADRQPQDDAQATPAPKIHQRDCRVPWEKPAEVVHNHIRGLSPYPGAWTRHDGMRLKIYRSQRAEGQGEPGTVLQAAGPLVVACGEGAVELLEIQQPGRQRMDTADFLNGYDLAEEERLT